MLQAGEVLQGQVLPADELLCTSDELLHGAARVLRIDRLCPGHCVLLCPGLDLLCAGPDVLQFDVEWNHGPAACDRRTGPGAWRLTRAAPAVQIAQFRGLSFLPVISKGWTS